MSISKHIHFRNWAINKHAAANHYYDGNLPYAFHLRLVHQEVEEYTDQLKGGEYEMSESLIDELVDAAYGHDLIEDTRSTYSDIIAAGATVTTANIIYAVTNEKGKNRKERASDKYYDGILSTPGADIIKLCDRIANVKYGILTKSTMVEMYKKEQAHFSKMLLNKNTAILFTKLNNLLYS